MCKHFLIYFLTVHSILLSACPLPCLCSFFSFPRLYCCNFYIFLARRNCFLSIIFFFFHNYPGYSQINAYSSKWTLVLFYSVKKKKFVGTALSFSLLKKSCLSIMQMFCFPFFNSPSADIYSFFHLGFGHFWRNLFLEVSRFCLFPIVNEIFELYPDFSSYSFSTSICWQVLAVLSASEI